MSKICNKCKEIKTLSEYFKDSKLKDGHRGQCKTCCNSRVVKPAVLYTEQFRICSKCCTNKEITHFYKSARSKGGYFSECKVCAHNRRTAARLCKKQVIQKAMITKPKRMKLTSEELLQRRNERRRKRYKDNIRFRLSVVIRQRAKNAITGKHKNSSAIALLGCDMDFMKRWIEHQFEPGMAWENFGEWQIDHVIPCASFDLTIYEHQKQCFNWKNNRPMWAKENQLKADLLDKALINSHYEKAEKFATLNSPKGVEGSTTT
jgi:hypothetical protein